MLLATSLLISASISAGLKGKEETVQTTAGRALMARIYQPKGPGPLPRLPSLQPQVLVVLGHCSTAVVENQSVALGV